MSKKIKVTLAGLVATLAIAPLLSFGVVSAACPTGSYSLGAGMGCASGGGQTSNSVEDTIGIIIDIAMWAVGIISIIIIVFAGIMYATAAGDESKVKKAKHALIGGIIGLAIAILAWTITNFVFSALS